jgi:transposase
MIKILLPAAEKQTLENAWRNHKKPYYRNRSQAILLISEGMKVKQVAAIFKVRTRTIYTWVESYENKGFIGLFIIAGRGLKGVMDNLTPDQVKMIKAEISQNPQSLREVTAILSTKLGFQITKKQLKAYLKKNSSTHGVGFESGLNPYKIMSNMPD